MGETRHDPGTFCWVELLTTEAGPAKDFYTKLLGWETEDDPLPSGGTYTMLRAAGGDVGGLYELFGELREQGVPPHWMPYVSVVSADATAERVKELGGTVLKEPFDVFTIGRMAVFRDPQGAVLSLWQPKTMGGTDCTDGRAGATCWFELATTDAEASRTFYEGLFGWGSDVHEAPGFKYTTWSTGGIAHSGMLQMTEEWKGMPPHWMVYFAVDDCDVSAERAKELDGDVCVPPTDIPGRGRFCVITDPQGAVFSLLKPETVSA